jgi:hypothetical protein
MFGFIILRCVKSKVHANYWIECYECIRNLYKENQIMIVDDNSDKNFIIEKVLFNTTVIDSEYIGRGELLPYIYYLKNNFVEKVVILHDTVFLKTYVDFENYNDTYLWHFEDHQWDNTKRETFLLSRLENNKSLLELYNSKRNWKGCFGVMSIISYKTLNQINSDHNLFMLLDHILNRSDRMCLERIFAVLLKLRNDNIVSIYGDITKHINFFRLSYDNYMNLKQYNSDVLPSAVKVWISR